MEDALLDMSQDELTVKETQLRDSPATFSRNLVDRFKIIGHNNQTGSETVNSTDNNIAVSYFITEPNASLHYTVWRETFVVGKLSANYKPCLAK